MLLLLLELLLELGLLLLLERPPPLVLRFFPSPPVRFFLAAFKLSIALASVAV